MGGAVAGVGSGGRAVGSEGRQCVGTMAGKFWGFGGLKGYL